MIKARNRLGRDGNGFFSKPIRIEQRIYDDARVGFFRLRARGGALPPCTRTFCFFRFATESASKGINGFRVKG